MLPASIHITLVLNLTGANDIFWTERAAWKLDGRGILRRGPESLDALLGHFVPCHKLPQVSNGGDTLAVIRPLFRPMGQPGGREREGGRERDPSLQRLYVVSWSYHSFSHPLPCSLSSVLVQYKVSVARPLVSRMKSHLLLYFSLPVSVASPQNGVDIKRSLNTVPPLLKMLIPITVDSMLSKLVAMNHLIG